MRGCALFCFRNREMGNLNKYCSRSVQTYPQILRIQMLYGGAEERSAWEWLKAQCALLL
jgi:hypothetical protein